MTKTNSPLLSVSNLKKHFSIGRRGFFSSGKTVYAVDGVSFTINVGETLGLVGESGSGKSTVGRCLLGLIEPTAGKIVFQDRDITHIHEKQRASILRDMQIVFQDPYGTLTPRLRISSLLREPLDVHAIEKPSNRDEVIARVMKKVGLRPEYAHRFPHEFSGGQRQRISIARAIILNPKLIIADEAVSALDVSIRAQVLNLLVDLQTEFNLAYLFISHDLSVVKYMSDRVAVLHLGKVVELAPRDELFGNFKHPYTEALLSAIPIPAVRPKARRIVLEGDIPSPMSPPKGCKFHTRCKRKIGDCEHLDPVFENRGNGHYVACHLA